MILLCKSYSGSKNLLSLWPLQEKIKIRTWQKKYTQRKYTWHGDSQYACMHM